MSPVRDCEGPMSGSCGHNCRREQYEDVDGLWLDGDIGDEERQ